MKRRNAFKSMIALAAAPAIVKVEMIMPVKPIVTPYEIGGNLVAFSDPNSVTIKVSNVYSGDIVSIVDVEARQIIAQEECLIELSLIQSYSGCLRDILLGFHEYFRLFKAEFFDQFIKKIDWADEKS